MPLDSRLRGNDVGLSVRRLPSAARLNIHLMLAFALGVSEHVTWILRLAAF